MMTNYYHNYYMLPESLNPQNVLNPRLSKSLRMRLSQSDLKNLKQQLFLKTMKIETCVTYENSDTPFNSPSLR